MDDKAEYEYPMAVRELTALLRDVRAARWMIQEYPGHQAEVALLRSVEQRLEDVLPPEPEAEEINQKTATPLVAVTG